jgi:hypothetical protein
VHAQEVRHSEVPLSRSRLTLLAAMLLLLSTPAWADRRYFVQTYTPYLAPAENLELETWAIAQEGRGDSTNTAWQTRAEFEYSISDRLTGAAYLNFVQDAGGPQRFDGPSLEVIYQLAEPGRCCSTPPCTSRCARTVKSWSSSPSCCSGAGTVYG